MGKITVGVFQVCPAFDLDKEGIELLKALELKSNNKILAHTKNEDLSKSLELAIEIFENNNKILKVKLFVDR